MLDKLVNKLKFIIIIKKKLLFNNIKQNKIKLS